MKPRRITRILEGQKRKAYSVLMGKCGGKNYSKKISYVGE
jgi:hypothetical protein